MAATPDAPSSKTAQEGGFGNATPPDTPLSQATRTKRKSPAQPAASPTAASGPTAKRQKLESSRVRRSSSDSHEKNHEKNREENHEKDQEKNHEKLATPPVNKPQGCMEPEDKPAQQPPSMARQLAADFHHCEIEDQAPEAAQEHGVVAELFRQMCKLRTQVWRLERKAKDDQKEIDRLRDQRNTVMAIARGQLETIDDLRRELWASKD